MVDTMSISDRIALARSYHSENRIIQNSWRRQGDDGRELVCALAAFGSDINSASQCPKDLMPEWLAQLIPTIDDGMAADEVHWFSGALIDCAERWHVLDDAAWQRIQTGFMIGSLKLALEAAEPVQPAPAPEYWPQVQNACEQVCAALKSGDAEQLKKAEAAAWAAARAAAWAAARAAEAAAWAAEAAAEAAAWAAEAAAWKNIASLLFGMIEAEIAAATTEVGHA